MEKVWIKNYQAGVPAHVDVTQYSSLVDLLEQTFAKFADKPAFTNFGTTLSFKEINEKSEAFASYLQNNLKLKKGDRVAIMMPNLLQYPIALFGVLRAGCIAVNVNPLYTARELEHQLKDSGAVAIVIVQNFANTLASVKDHVPSLKNIILTEVGDMLSPLKGTIINFVLKHVKKMVPAFDLPTAIPFKRALQDGATYTFQRATVTLEDIAFLQYTGGTTGVAKGAMLTHGNMCANMTQARAWISQMTIQGQEIIVTALPLYHIFSLTANCFAYMSLGGLNLLITNPRDFKAFIKELKKWRFTAFTGVNTLFNALLHHPDFKSIDFSSLKLALGGGMAVQKAVAEKWKQVTGVPLIEAYGLTETSPAACMNPMDLKEYNGFIGLPIQETIVAILDENEKPLGFDEVGEICIKGPQVMKGYWNHEDETKKVMTQKGEMAGYLKTGDMGYMNKDGFVKLVDRKKDMILVSGFNVYPNEVEDVAVTHPKVLEAAAIGVANEHSGEVVKLFVVKKDESLTEAELIAFCKKNMTNYKVPKEIEFRKDLPKSNVGKILRKDLKPKT